MGMDDAETRIVLDMRQRVEAALGWDITDRTRMKETRLQIVAALLDQAEVLPRGALARIFGRGQSWLNYATATIARRQRSNYAFRLWVNRIAEQMPDILNPNVPTFPIIHAEPARPEFERPSMSAPIAPSMPLMTSPSASQTADSMRSAMSATTTPTTRASRGRG
jgi:hypothetical protein